MRILRSLSSVHFIIWVSGVSAFLKQKTENGSGKYTSTIYQILINLLENKKKTIRINWQLVCIKMGTVIGSSTFI